MVTEYIVFQGGYGCMRITLASSLEIKFQILPGLPAID